MSTCRFTLSSHGIQRLTFALGMTGFYSGQRKKSLYNSFQTFVLVTDPNSKHRIQFNVGIIAACIPSLKPLVSKALKFPEYSNTNRTRGLYGSRSRPRRTPTAPGGSMPTIMIRGNNPIWSIHKGDQYSLQALGSRDSGSRSDGELAGEKSATTRYTEKWYSTDCLHPGSQDYEEKDGIIKTTEIIVT